MQKRSTLARLLGRLLTGKGIMEKRTDIFRTCSVLPNLCHKSCPLSQGKLFKF